MTAPVRQRIFLPIAAVLFLIFLWGVLGLPPVGKYRGPYGDVLNSAATAERHATNVVAAVNFDYRGFDTLGEEFILFASVMGTTLLLRRLPGEAKRPPEETLPGRSVPQSSDAVRVLTLGLTGVTLLFGVYIVVHGQLTPGGGFQGGVVLATCFLLIYLARDFATFERIASHLLVEVAEAVGVGAFVIAGMIGLAAGLPFLANIVPLGPIGKVTSGGLIPLISLSTGLAVSAGFILLLVAFLEETLELRLEEEQ